ncbi:hypothetical protein ISN45_At05g041050 [Arabidopsis thaliana x Arabidopsis arenosa]|uniref:Uncharacterized protein n=2 Tax=Arabidopsis TaxID=3701 RepID=A0A8T2DM56_ARASU|nr:hypothetical protein ISN45_At05g041050 [Arabidopsis thaliana x Arabidopsis arenosa]KAG7611996.1 hypothetical protein ISN44_As05g040600 [Arabidopsis suecica]
MFFCNYRVDDDRLPMKQCVAPPYLILSHDTLSIVLF